MSLGVRTTLGALPGQLKREEQRLVNAIKRACEETAKKAVVPIRERVPVAFGELRDSIQGFTTGKHGVPATVADAPHAGPVEQGSMPHTPDWEALLAWVKLRGMQGLNKSGRGIRKRFSRSEGPTTPAQARSVATALKDYEVRGTRKVGRHTPINAAEEVARAISEKIKHEGTRPHWFVRDSLGDIRGILDGELKKRIFARETRAESEAIPLVNFLGTGKWQ